MVESLSEGRYMSEDLTRKLPKNDSDKLDLILTILQNLEGRLQKLEIWVDRFNLDFKSVEQKLDALEQKVEERIYDTRPIWHKVVADIALLQNGQDSLRFEVRELGSTVRDVNRDQIVINDAIRKTNLDFHTIDERLHKLELSRKP